MDGPSESVSGIHKRYTLTLLNPSSHYQSLVLAVATVAGVAAVAAFWYGMGEYATALALSVPVLLATQAADSRLVRNREYSKALHMSLFGNLIWLAATSAAVLAAQVVGRPEPTDMHLATGMFLFVAFRIGIYTTVLGASLRKAWGICLLQPLPLFLCIVPMEHWNVLLEPVPLAAGAILVVMASVWSKLTDAAGRPSVQSTHELIQVYLSSQSESHEDIESIIESRSSPSTVRTRQVRLCSDGGDVRMVLPEIHPGPYHPIGGSNVSYRIYEALGSSAMVMHSISDHSLNLPSQEQVEKYLDGLRAEPSGVLGGDSCTEPVVVQVNRARVTGILFGRSPLLLLSLSPEGMEDLPSHVRTDIESFAKGRGFEEVMVADCHNAMGGQISGPDVGDMLKASKSCLDELVAAQSKPFQFGYAGSQPGAPDLADGGIGVLCLRVDGSDYFLGWADANNMENGVREAVVESFRASGRRMLELFTSDTHFSRVRVRNKNGYYQFGIVSKPADISKWFLELASKAEAAAARGRFEVLENVSKTKVMGPKIFEDFKAAMDNSLRITKAFASAGFAVLLAAILIW